MGREANNLPKRIQVRASVSNCCLCPLHTERVRPVAFSGHNPSWLAVIGEAPGRDENELGEPFVGPSGRLLRRYLDELGGEGFAGAIAYLNVVSCWPDRTPTKREIDACKPNLDAQLDAVVPVYGLVVGGVALQALGITCRMGEAQGRWFWNNQAGFWMLANWHPSAVLRAGLETRLGRQFRFNIARFVKQVLEYPSEPPVQKECIKCGELAVDWAKDRTGWCAKHRPFIPPPDAQEGKSKAGTKGRTKRGSSTAPSTATSTPQKQGSFMPKQEKT